VSLPIQRIVQQFVPAGAELFHSRELVPSRRCPEQLEREPYESADFLRGIRYDLHPEGICLHLEFRPFTGTARKKRAPRGFRVDAGESEEDLAWIEIEPVQGPARRVIGPGGQRRQNPHHIDQREPPLSGDGFSHGDPVDPLKADDRPCSVAQALDRGKEGRVGMLLDFAKITVEHLESGCVGHCIRW